MGRLAELTLFRQAKDGGMGMDPGPLCIGAGPGRFTASPRSSLAPFGKNGPPGMGSYDEVRLSAGRLGGWVRVERSQQGLGDGVVGAESDV